MFWERFYNLCKNSNLSPNAVCAQLDLSKATATHWKNGTTPNGDVLVKIALYFNTSIDYLMGLTENNKQLTQDEKDILHILNSIDSKYNRAKLLGYVECYAKQIIESEAKSDLKHHA